MLIIALVDDSFIKGRISVEGGKRARMRALTRQKILQTALALFAERGYFGTTIDLISKRCRISKGLIYHYFTNKQDILVAVLEEGLRAGYDLLKGLEDIPDPFQQFAVMIERSFDEMLRNEAYWRLYFHVLLQPGVLELFAQRLTAFYQESIQYFVLLFRRMNVTNAEIEARLLTAMLDGLGLHYFLVGRDFPLAEVKNAIIQRYSRPLDGNVDR